MPEPIVPNQKASTSSLATPAESKAAVAESTSRSSAPLSQCSPNGVHPMPTMATRSRMPLDAVYRADLAERHLDPVADGDAPGVDVGHLAAEAAAAVEVDDGGDDGRRK